MAAASARQGDRLVTLVRGLAVFLALAASAVGPFAPDPSFSFRIRIVVGMLFFVSGALWVMSMAMVGRLRLKATGLEMPGLLFLALVTASAVMAVSVRPSVAQAALWISYAAGFLVILHLADNARLQGLLAAVVFASAVVVACHGLFQWAVAMPETRAAFYRDPMAAMEMAGISADSFSEFQGRLTADRVMSTFLSPNSLAGFLVLVFPMALGLALDQWRERRLELSPLHFTLNAAGLGAMLLALYQTRSKGGWIAFGVALVVFIVRGQPWLRRRVAKPLLVTVAVALVCLLTAERYGLTPKLRDYVGSVSVRLPYWRAAVRIAAERPLLGVGGGNFGDAYTALKEPLDQETRHVHNDYLQVACELGTVALILYVLMWWRFWGRVWQTPPVAQDVAFEEEPFLGWWWKTGLALWGLVFAVVWAAWLLPGAGGAVWGWFWPLVLAVGWLAFLLLNHQRNARLAMTPASASAAGILAGLVGFLVHGMIDFDLQVHGIAQTVAALAALALAVWSRATPPSHLVDRPVGPWSRLALTALATGLVFGLWCGLAEPAARAADEVQRAQDALSEAQVLMREAASPRRMLPEADRESVLRRATDRVISALRHLQRAVQLDPRHDEALAMLADCHLRLHLEGQAVDPADGAPHLSKAMRYASLARAANPGRSSHFLRLGRLFFETWRVTGWPDTVHKAYDSIRRAVSLFPSLPMAHVEFADACERMNSPAEALEHYREALRLDKMQYHDTRRRLTQEQRDRVERRVAAWEKALRMYRPQ